MRPERRTELLVTLRDTPRRVEGLLRGQPRSVLAWIPAPGKWAILEIVRHLRDHETAACLDPYRRILAGERPALLDTDMRAPAAGHGARSEPVSEIVRVWKRARREVVELLEGLDDGAWALEARHPVAGPIALAALVEMQLQHDRDHLGQIESNLERRSILDRLESVRRQMRERIELAAVVPGIDVRAHALGEAVRLREFESRMLARYVAILEHERPELPPLDADTPFDPPAGADLLEMWREFEQLRSGTLELLHAMGAKLWQRRGVHPHRGDLTIAELVTQHLDHDAARLAALRALTERAPGAMLVRDVRPPEPPRTTA